MRERNFTPRRPGKPAHRQRPPRGGSGPRPGGRAAFADRDRSRGGGPDGPVILYGWHTVKAALENPARRVRRLFATENAMRRLTEGGIALPEPPELVRPGAIAARLGPDAVHNGLLAEGDPPPDLQVDAIAAPGPVLLLVPSNDT